MEIILSLPFCGFGISGTLHGGPCGDFKSSCLGTSGLATDGSSSSLSDTWWNGKCPKLSLISLVKSLASSAASLCCWPLAYANGLVPKLALTLVPWNFFKWWPLCYKALQNDLCIQKKMAFCSAGESSKWSPYIINIRLIR